MKKVLNFISIFILMLTVVSGTFFIRDNAVVEAAEDKSATWNGTKNGANYYIMQNFVREYKNTSGKIYGTLTIETPGVITIDYAYGYTELLVVAQKCLQPDDQTEGMSCSSWDENVHLFFFGGDYNKSHPDNKNVETKNGKKTVNLYPAFGVKDLVRVSVITEFATEPNPANDSSDLEYKYNYNKIDGDSESYNAGFYKPMYCNINLNTPNCYYEEFRSNIFDDKKLGSQFAPSRRVVTFAETSTSSDGLGKNASQYTVHNLGGAVIYQGYTHTKTPAVSNDVVSFDVAMADEYVVQDVIVKVDNAAVKKSEDEILSTVYDTVIPALLVAVSLLALVTCTVLGYKIVKSADEPQERQEKISRLKNILIGIAIAYVILFSFEPVVEFVKGMLE